MKQSLNTAAHRRLIDSPVLPTICCKPACYATALCCTMKCQSSTYTNEAMGHFHNRSLAHPAYASMHVLKSLLALSTMLLHTMAFTSFATQLRFEVCTPRAMAA